MRRRPEHSNDYKETANTIGVPPIRRGLMGAYRENITLSHPTVSVVHARRLSDEIQEACVKLGRGATMSCHPHSRELTQVTVLRYEDLFGARCLKTC